MAVTRVTVDTFLSLAKAHPVLDVRSPGEYGYAHIPGAYSLPLFTDEERKIVGTAYKQQSQQKAIKLGLEFYGTKMVKMVEEVEELLRAGSTKYEAQKDKDAMPRTTHSVLVHCWRGGMRSAGVAWLLDLYGYKVYTLAGGYKAYRKWVLAQFEKTYPIRILGGFTGSGKTEILRALADKNQAVIDLERIASHKGSAFGNLGQPKQPSQEMFENLLATELQMINDTWQLTEQNARDFNPPPAIWLEDESQRIGEINIPVSFYRQMRNKPLYFLNIPFEERLQYIITHYGNFEKEKLVNTIIRIRKRLGGLETQNAVNFLIENNTRECFSILLGYYDKFYLKSLQNRDNFSEIFTKIELPAVAAEANAERLLEEVKAGVTAG